MIPPKTEYVKFNNLEEKLKKLKELQLIPPKADEVKDLFYKGSYVELPTLCEIVGYVDNFEIIIDIEGKLHSIHPAYLREMQNKNFNLYNSKDDTI